MRSIHRLSARAVSTLTRAGYHPDGAGLYLQIATGGSKSWIFRYALRGRSREMGLGSASLVSLAQARERATECRRQLADRIDPIDARTRVYALDDHTFDACAKAYIKANKGGWKNGKHIAQWTNTLATYASPVIGSTPVAAIGIDQIVRVLEPIWTIKTETATRVRQRIEAVLDYATVKKYRAGDNPARWRGTLNKILPKPTKVTEVEHFPALPYADLPAFMARLCKRDDMSALALRFTILTCARTGETIGADWSEINGHTWIVPGSRMKSGKDHSAPLSLAALDVLAIIRPHWHTGAIFRYRGKRLSNNAMLALLARMARGDITVHGFRSTFTDWTSDETEHAPETIDMALAHVVSDKTEAAYRRGVLLKKRRALADEWAAYCMQEVKLPVSASARPAMRKSQTPTTAKRCRS